jgi:hypothetical protein
VYASLESAMDGAGSSTSMSLEKDSRYTPAKFGGLVSSRNQVGKVEKPLNSCFVEEGVVCGFFDDWMVPS